MIIDAPKKSHRTALRALWQEAFGDTEAFLDTFEATAFAQDRCRCVLEDEGPVAALYWFDCSLGDKRIAYLYAIATAKDRRGQGLCRALMEDTHRHLASLGYACTILVPGDKELFSFYEKLGYRVCAHIGELASAASDTPTDHREIGIEEYAERRRALLPPNGIRQENQNLTFLQAQASLYTGEGFLLAARREGDTLFGLELLGDTRKAPALVHALGCKTGHFRTVGKDKPFAMYFALNDQAPTPPFHFGLSFD